MNKAITDSIVFNPLPFSAGLGVWSSGTGVPGSDTYATSGSGVFVAADPDFAGCLEVLKSDPVVRVRYMGQTPILPGCYLQVTVRIKAVAGPLPAVRVSGWAGRANGSQVTGLPIAGPATPLTSYGTVVTIRAIIATAERNGVDFAWPGASYGHLGIDLTGPSGGLVRIDDITIEDVSAMFIRDLVSRVDVRDYGAKGDGVTDNTAAFLAADAAAKGRTVIVPAGDYRLDGSVTMQNNTRFEGRIVQAAQHRFILQRGYNFDTYLDAFKDEETGFKKAYQALINFADHESLDLCGRRILLTEPVDMQACDPSRTRFEMRRVIRNGQFEPDDSAAWDSNIVTAQASYSAANERELTNVAGIDRIAVGSLVTGAGVGREVYVTAVDVARDRLTLSNALYDAEGRQDFTFTRFRYLLDFSGYEKLSQFILSDIEFQCRGIASGIMMAPEGLTFHLRDCFVNRPRDRGLTSPGYGCHGMMIDRCQFISSEQPIPVTERVSIGFNANGNDVKIRDNRTNRFLHFCVLAGSGSLITSNHWFHGDEVPSGVRKGGIIMTLPNPRSVFTGNYCDNSSIEWTNEHSSSPALGAQFSFGGLTVNGNIFTTIDVAPWFNFITIKPYGPGHYINGFAVVGNVFRSINGRITRVEGVDTTFANLDFSRTRSFEFTANTFHNVDIPVSNPVVLSHQQATAAATWVMNTGTALPFGGRARHVDSVMPDGAITSGSNQRVHDLPWAEGEKGADQRSVHLNWNLPVRGRVRYQVRMDQTA